MLKAFLYDFKKALIQNLDWSKFRAIPKWSLAALVTSLILYFVSAIFLCYWLFLISMMLSIVSLIIVGRQSKLKEKKSKGNSSDKATIPCMQTQWFLDNRVAVVKKMLDSNNTGLAPSKCIGLLLVECKNKLTSTRPSEILQKRTKPILVPIIIFFISLLTAWLNIMLPGTNIPYEESFFQLLLAVMKELSGNIILNRTLMVYFTFSCIYAIMIYYAIVLIVLPVIEKFVDREFLLTADLMDILLYLEHDDSFTEYEMMRKSER